ncbi:uncharacterized protein LOC6539004 [Drosophila yakuba]|uniref:Uncharacterized protein n=1 Tax=Drosophila yakuba TaxID=7245 RepID=B4PND6_DROYA|nr:uncharacterized protein LOC6539004 [Drosophila yakuba]EDW99218.1 uncharacterized protein Dyak_GE23319 [Drosophila yakuba]
MNRPSATKKDHVVLVTLTDAKRRAYLDDQSLENDIRLLDSKSMLLRMPKSTAKPASLGEPPRYYRHLEFDGIGYEYDGHIRSEVGDLLGQMFRHRRHGSLLRISSQRNHNPSLLTRLLVTEVDSLMVEMRCRLKAVNVDYFDVRKFEMVNMLVQPTAVPKRRRVSPSGKSVSSTKELSQWLTNDLTPLRSRAIGDDYLHFEFVYRDSLVLEHRIHLSVFHIFGSENRPDLVEFFTSLPRGRQSGSTLLNDCLKESFDFKSPAPAVVLFELPIASDLKDARRKILKVADVAYESLEKARKMMSKSKCKPVSQSSTNLSKTSKSSGAHSSLRSVPNISLAHWRRTAKFSDEDYNGLALWYGRIDSKFAELKLAMEQHVVDLYRRKSLDLRSEIRSIHQDPSEETDESGGDGVRPQRTPRDLHTSSKVYSQLKKDFQKLETEAEATTYAPTLKVYISTKNYELSEAEKVLRQREVENLRLGLIQYIGASDSSVSGD